MGEPRPGSLSHGTITFPQDLRARALTVSARAIPVCRGKARWRHPARHPRPGAGPPDRRGGGAPHGDGPRFQDAAPAGRASHDVGVHWAHLAPNRNRSLNYSVRQGKHRYDCPSRRANQKHRIPECSGRIRHQAGCGAQAAQSCRMGHFRRFAGCTRVYGWEPPRRLRAQARLTQRRIHRGQTPQRKAGKTSTAAAGVLLSGRGEDWPC